MLTNLHLVWAALEKRPEVNGHARSDFSAWTCEKLRIHSCWLGWAWVLLIERVNKKDADTSKRSYFAPVSAVENDWISQLALPVNGDDEL